jgi:hypothetical protein
MFVEIVVLSFMELCQLCAAFSFVKSDSMITAADRINVSLLFISIDTLSNIFFLK